MSAGDRFGSAIAENGRVVILVTVLALGVLALGLPMVESLTSLDQFQSDSPEGEAQTFIEENFEGEAEVTTAQIVIRGENVLAQESLVETLRYQQRLRESETVNRTLVEEGAMTSVANVVALGLLQSDQQETEMDDLDPETVNSSTEAGDAPTLDRQIERVEAADEEELAAVIENVLGGTGQREGAVNPLGLLPTDYDAGSQSADATIMIVTQHREVEAGVEEAAGPGTVEAQLAMRDLGTASESGLEFRVLGSGIISHEIDSSMADSLIIVGPLALVFVLLALSVAYRDPLDILLGVVGIIAVLLGTFGFMGWAGIAFGQLFVAVPVLLIGLSIDYAIHLFMRHRETRREIGDVRPAMGVALAGVGTAFLLVTASTAVGFLSNLTSPVPPIQEFGIVSAAGIVLALLVFGLLVPALKVELDEVLESRGIDRQKRAFGTGGGPVGTVLTPGATAARRIPVVVLLLVALVTTGGIVAGLGVDTSFEQEDFLADEPPNWMTQLPEPFAPDEYTAKSTIRFLDDRFTRAGASTDILIQGDITEPQTLERIDDAERTAGEQSVTQQLPDGQPGVDSPVTVMRSVAATNESFNESFQAAGGGPESVPDRNIEQLYDELFEIAPATAGQYIARTDDGEYRAARLRVGIQGGADDRAVTDQMRTVAASLDGDGLTATATGSTILNVIVQDQLLETVIESLVITLLVILVFLSIVYRATDGSALLGPVTLLPVALAAAWILGTMFLLDIPFNVLTGMILSLTVGLGVAYSIHLSERYTLELDRQGAVWPAMETAVTGTGGALLGSAATTVGGFGVLIFAILPPLRQFGLITALSIGYAFLATVFVLPTLLALWTRFVGPSWARGQVTGEDADSTTDASTDQNTEEATEQTADNRENI